MKIVIVSAVDDDEKIDEYLAYDSVYYLQKPISLGELDMLVKSIG